MVYKIVLALAVIAKLSTLTYQQTTTTEVTVTVQNQGDTTCSENEEMCLDDSALLICVPVNDCDIENVKITFKVNAAYDSINWLIKLGLDVFFKTFLSQTLAVPFDSVKDLKHYDGSIGVNATIDYSQNLVKNLDNLRYLVQNEEEIGIGSSVYPFISDSFHAQVIREGIVPSTVTATIWLPSSTAVYTGSSVSTPSTTEASIPTESTICNETEVSCLDDLGHSICLPQEAEEVCDVISVLLSFTINANYKLFRFVINVLIDIFRYLLAELLDIDLDDILDVDIFEGSIIVQTEVRDSDRLNAVIDDLRDRFNSGNATVNMMGGNYSVQPNSFTVTIKRNVTTTTPSSLINGTSANFTCLENEETCLDDAGIEICVPESLCDIIDIIVTFKIDAAYDILKPFLVTLYAIVKELVARFLNVDTSTILNIQFFNGSLGVMATLGPDAASHIVELREEILSGGQVELLGVSYDVMPDSFNITVNKDATNTSIPRSSNITTGAPLIAYTSPSDNLTCLPNEDPCLDSIGYDICVPKSLCGILEIVVTFKIHAVFDVLAPFFNFISSTMKNIVATFLNVDTSSVLDITFFEGSLGVNATLGPDTAGNVDTMRKNMKSGGQVTLMGLTYDIVQDSFHVTVKSDVTTTTPSSLINATSANFTCLENEETCLDDAGIEICLPESLCDIIDIIVTFKIDAAYNILQPFFVTLYEIVKELVARFLNVDTSTILNIQFFNGSLGIMATLGPDAASHIVDLREEILSGGQVELLGVSYDVMPASFNITVNKGTTNTSVSGGSNITTGAPLIYFTSPSDNLTCLPNEDPCLDSTGYDICVPKSLCGILEIVVTFKIHAVFDVLAPFFNVISSTMKNIVATFLNVDTSSVLDITFFEGSLGVNATLGPDTAGNVDTMRKNMESGGQVTLMGLTYDIVQDSFHVTVNSATPTIIPQNYSSYDQTSYNYDNMTMSNAEDYKVVTTKRADETSTANLDTTEEISTKVVEVTTTDGVEVTFNEEVENTTTDEVEDTTTDEVEDTTTHRVEVTTIEEVEVVTTTHRVEQTTTDRVEETTTDRAEVTTTDRVEDTTTDEVEVTTIDGVEDTTTGGVKDTTEMSTSQSTELDHTLSTATTEKGETVGGSVATNRSATTVNLPVTTKTYIIQTDADVNDTTAGSNILEGNLAVLLLVTAIYSVI